MNRRWRYYCLVLCLGLLSGLVLRRDSKNLEIPRTNLATTHDLAGDASPVCLTEEETLAKFADWIKQYDASSSDPAFIRRGTELAARRRTVMKALLCKNPQFALRFAVSSSDKSKLPVEVAGLLENWVCAQGDLTVVAATQAPNSSARPELDRFAFIDGKNYRAGAFGTLSRQPSLENVALTGIVLDDAIALADSKLRSDHRVTSRATPIGSQSVLLMRLDFDDLPGEPNDIYDDPLTFTAAQTLITTSMNGFYLAQSYGKVAFPTVAVTPVLRLPRTQWEYQMSQDYIGLRVDAIAAAQAAGFNYAEYDIDISAFAYTFSGNWAGRGQLGGRGIWLNGYFDFRVTSHEIGHNFGCHHANLWHTFDGSVTGPGISDEYEDSFDIMGSNPLYGERASFNAAAKSRMGWFNAGEVATPAASGIFRIFALEKNIPSGLHALRIPKDASRDYWFEFRDAIDDFQVVDAALVHWGNKFDTYTNLLDMAPETPGDPTDAPLQTNHSFNDDEAGFAIVPTGRDIGTPESLYLSLTLINWPDPPSLSSTQPLSALQLNADAGIPGTYVYTPDFGTLLPVGAGQVLSVEFTPQNLSYPMARKSVRVDVGEKASQTISFPSIGDRILELGSFKLSASASSGLPVEYSVSSGPAVINGDSVTLTGAGTVVISASQPGNSSYFPAPSVSQQFEVTSNQPPVISVQPRAVPSTANKGQSISFMVFASDPDGDLLTYTWNFGDTAAANGPTPTHAYSQSGIHTVTVSVSDGILSVEKTVQVTIVDRAPVFASQAGAAPNPAATLQLITFTASGTDPDGDSLLYTWNFGDGGATGNGATATHSYSQTGVYTVAASVSDGELTANQTFNVTIVADNAPEFLTEPQASPAVVALGETVQFTASGFDADGDALTYEWKFGDSTTDSGATVSHTYSFAGNYAATVTIKAGLQSSTRSVNVTVTNNPLTITKFSIKLDFAKSVGSKIQLQGILAAPPGFNYKTPPHVEVGGARWAKQSGSFAKPKSGITKYSVAMSGPELAAGLADEGLVNQTVKDKKVYVFVVLTVEGVKYQRLAALLYTAKAGKSGTAAMGK